MAHLTLPFSVYFFLFPFSPFLFLLNLNVSGSDKVDYDDRIIKLIGIIEEKKKINEAIGPLFTLSSILSGLELCSILSLRYHINSSYDMLHRDQLSEILTLVVFSVAAS
ncbi:hypothetical protein BDV25DRAFT_154479 [Aspergillus avenaceus]|uniref:Uncharacterized protein n=1 Tax=Aspergillus avenaceus TaxID=36643 RepID=A0A5N6TVS7_ASPAV|nr:hypothetical protein BDV25DRAFT_154479 [Aspergillus avenaceus]